MFNIKTFRNKDFNNCSSALTPAFAPYQINQYLVAESKDRLTDCVYNCESMTGIISFFFSFSFPKISLFDPTIL